MAEYVEPHLGVKKLDDMVERYVEVTANKPCKVLGICGFVTFLLFLMTATTQAAVLANADWYITDELSVERQVRARARFRPRFRPFRARAPRAPTASSDARHARVPLVQDMIDSAEKKLIPLGSGPQERAESSDWFFFFYDQKKKSKTSVFTAANVKDMCETELWYFHNSEYDNYCQLSGGKCAAPSLSLPYNVYTYAGYNTSDTAFPFGETFTMAAGCPLLPEATVAAYGDFLVDQMNSEAGQLMYGFFMADDTVSKGYSVRTRSGIPFGGPLKCSVKEHNWHPGVLEDLEVQFADPDKCKGVNTTFPTLSIIGDYQGHFYQNFFVPVTEDLWKLFGMGADPGKRTPMADTPFMSDAHVGGLRVRWFSWGMWNWESFMIFNTDQVVIYATMLFVFGTLWFYIGSWLLATFGMMQIIFSLRVALTIYWYLFGMHYYGTMQILSIFIILGIGADDIFVLADAWKQSAADVPKIPASEGQAYEIDWFKARLRYAYVRTAEAVLNTSFTTFAAFCATAIGSAGVLPIMTFGVYSAVCVAVNYFFVISLTPPMLVIEELRLRRYKRADRTKCCWPITFMGCCGCCSCCPGSTCAWVDAEPPSETPKSLDDSAPEVAAEDRMQRAVKKYIEVIEKPGVAPVLTGGFAVLAVIMAWRASMLEPPLEQEKWLPADHMFTQCQDLIQEKFLSAGSDDYAEMKVVWGMKDISRTKYNMYEPAINRGEVKFDGAFDPTDADAQAAMLEACTLLESWTCKEKACEFGKLMRPGEIRCPMREFHAWLNSSASEAAPYAGGPWTATTVSGCASGDCTYDIPTYLSATEWTDALYAFRASATPENFPMLTWEKDIGFTGDSTNPQLKYMSTTAKMTMKLLQAVTVKDPIEERAEKYVKAISKPAAAKTVWQYSFDWTWSATQTGMITGMEVGMAIAFPLAFVVLMVATMNWAIALLAIFSVMAICASVLGYCECIGWNLGTGEAIAGVMVIGLSVDYTIHLGHMYADAEHMIGARSRKERFEFAAEKMVSTVCAGALTTGGGGVWMFLATSVFFGKMATLICFTVLFSLIFALFWFMPALYLVGPQDDFGTITKKKAHGSKPADAKPMEESKGDVSVELAAVADEPKTEAEA